MYYILKFRIVQRNALYFELSTDCVFFLISNCMRNAFLIYTTEGVCVLLF